MKVEYQRCQQCGKRIDKQALFLVRGKRVCGTCGAALIRESNVQAKQALA